MHYKVFQERQGVMHNKLRIVPSRNLLNIPVVGVLVLMNLLIFTTSMSFAFLYKLDILDKEAIAKLSDEALVDTYIEVIIEIEVSTTFHQTSGFTPRDYEKHKDFLRYRINLIREIQKRELKVPKIRL